VIKKLLKNYKKKIRIIVEDCGCGNVGHWGEIECSFCINTPWSVYNIRKIQTAYNDSRKKPCQMK